MHLLPAFDFYDQFLPEGPGVRTVGLCRGPDGLRIEEKEVEKLDVRSIVPRGPHLLRELLPDWKGLHGKPFRFYALFRGSAPSGEKIPLGLFPAKTSGTIEYYDFSDYYVSTGLLRRVGDPAAFGEWKAFAEARRLDRRRIEAFKNEFFPSRNFRRKGDDHGLHPYVYAEHAPSLESSTLRPIDIDALAENGEIPDFLKPKPGFHRAVFVVLPTVYSFAHGRNPEADGDFHRHCFEAASGYPFKNGDTLVDLCVGAGHVLWLDHLALRERARTVRAIGVDLNPLAVLSARINLNEVLGLCADLRVGDNLPPPEELGGSAAFLTCNGPMYDRQKKPAPAGRMTRIHDGGRGSERFWHKFLRALPRSMDSKRGLAIVWNSLWFPRDPAAEAMRRKNWNFETLHRARLGPRTYRIRFSPAVSGARPDLRVKCV